MTATGVAVYSGDMTTTRSLLDPAGPCARFNRSPRFRWCAICGHTSGSHRWTVREVDATTFWVVDALSGERHPAPRAFHNAAQAEENAQAWNKAAYERGQGR